MPDEGEADVVDAGLEREREVAQVLLRERGRAHVHSGEVHPLVRAEQAAADDAARDARRVDLLDTELHAAIVEEDATAGQDVPGEVRVRGRDLAGLGDGFRREDDEVARVELHGVREHAGPDLRAGEVGEDRERLVQRVRGLAVGQPFHAHQHQQRALLGRQAGEAGQ